MSIASYLESLQDDQIAKEEFAETLLADIMDQLSVLDPAEDADELLTMFSIHRKTKAGRDLLSYLLGTPSLEEWTDQFTDI